MERSFEEEVRSLRLGDGDTFHGEGILAITKALLQSGVSYVGGYQGAPVSHVMDVLTDAQDLLDEMGIHFEICSNEAAAAAMCAASINYPIRGAVCWKSVVGKDVTPMAGEYTLGVVIAGLAKFVEGALPQGVDHADVARRTAAVAAIKSKAMGLLGHPTPARPPGFCTGCPERPVFTAIKLVGAIHVAAGQQHTPSTGTNFRAEPTGQNIRDALKGLGVKLQRTVTTYEVGSMMKTLSKALTTKTKGLKVIIAESECQLAKQRRIRPMLRKKLEQGERLIRTRFGVDDDVCTGNHSCIRLSGCPSLTIKPNPDPLRKDPVAHVNNGCVGCWLCGEAADAATLCPSFYRADIVQNPSVWDRWLDGIRRKVIGFLQGPPAVA